MTAIAQSLGWALLHSLWEGALISAAFAIVLFATRSPRIRYTCALLALVAILVSFGVTFGRVLAVDVGTSALTHRPQSQWIAPRVNTPVPVWPASIDEAVPWLAPFWLAGVFVFYARQFAAFRAVRRLRTVGVCPAPSLWLARIEQLRHTMRISPPVQLLESCLVNVPVVLGHLRPIILVPAGLFTGFPAPQLETILLHELAHIRRHDYLINAFQRATEGLFFYHPGVWWISHVMRAERENCCDDAVVSVRGNAHLYAIALAALEEQRANLQPVLAATGGSLMKRIRRLLYPQPSHALWMPVAAATVFLATAFLAMAAMQSDTPADPNSPIRYSKWVNEDVVYIIDDAERAAFERLATDGERDHFIEQFWDRRNPAPGSSTNAFKEEHYRRIAYANQHFRTATGALGWKTDRGRAYIIYGPPDEINSYPHPDNGQFPRDEWLYHHIEGLGDQKLLTFVDKSGRGDYRLAPGTTDHR